LFNVANRPDQHIELKPIENLLKIIDVNKHSYLEIYQPKIKEAMDYAFVMQYFYSDFNDTCRNLLIIEDDSIASFDWYTKIIEGIESVPKSSSNKWLVLKLFTSYRFQDWLIHPYTVFTTLFTVFTLVSIQYYVLKQTSYFKMFSIKFWLNSTSICPLGTGVIKYSQGFNTVANVYPFEKLNILIQTLEMSVSNYVKLGKPFIPKDMTISKLGYNLYLEEFILEPSVFQHVGFHSSLSKIDQINMENLLNNQYRPFKSYTFEKYYFRLIDFNPLISKNNSK
jgi:hypothetical protein